MLFVILLFFLKTTTIFKNKETYQKNNPENGLNYSNVAIKDLINKDTDGDGVLDWEESLWGTDPSKKDTNGDGTSDSVEIENIKKQTGKSEISNLSPENTENLTETDRFSRELFATIAAANQNGTMDQAAIEALSTTLAEKIKNPIARKVFLPSDIKTIKDDSVQAVENYFKTMNGIQEKYPVKESVASVLQKFLADENNVDTSVLAELDGAINQTQKIINEILKVNVPQSLTPLHLDLLNAGERLMENVSDMKLFDSDPIIVIGAASKYEENMNLFQSALKALISAIGKKLNN